MPENKPDMDLSTLSTLAEPNRKAIVELLRTGPLTIGEIANNLGLRQPQASKHLKILSDSGTGFNNLAEYLIDMQNKQS